MDPCPGVPLGNDLPVPRSCHVFMLTIFYCRLYTALPHLQASIPGPDPSVQCLSAAGWALTSLAFSVYFRYFGSYAVTYGSLTAVILFMLWLYASICILFVGAEINWFLLFYREGIQISQKKTASDPTTKI